MTIIPYSEDALASALSNECTPVDVIKDKKKHFRYLKSYLEHPEVNAKTIVIESEYISKDYLYDYASYYALCFKPYPKVCKRVHFFALNFTEVDFDQMLTDSTKLQIDIPGSYLGFIVVKPIPYTIIGYSLLKVYSNSPTTRQFWGAKKYDVHLFGKKLQVESLAFQEQDGILAACATTAIWSMLNKASDSRLAILKTPNEITKDSGILSHDGSRLFPNKGLDIKQICQAIYQSGLATEVKQPDIFVPSSDFPLCPYKKVISRTRLRKILNAYSAIGIPLILVIGVPNGATYGLHAITVSGFQQSNPTPIPSDPKISFHSDNISKFYAHDDQFGPFVRIEWLNELEIKTKWDEIDRKTFVLQVVVPTFPKIRIPYEDIEIIIQGLDRILTTTFGTGTIHDLVWDIKIDLSENYKRVIGALDPTSFPLKLRHLKRNLPKYVWIATCYIGANPILKIVFDATGVSRAMLGLDIFSFLPTTITEDIYQFLDKNKANSAIVNTASHTASNDYYKFYMDNIRN